MICLAWGGREGGRERERERFLGIGGARMSVRMKN